MLSFFWSVNQYGLPMLVNNQQLNWEILYKSRNKFIITVDYKLASVHSRQVITYMVQVLDKHHLSYFATPRTGPTLGVAA